MMVDPMFVIVQSLRSFLTALTPTVTVAPIAVINRPGVAGAVL